MNVIIRYVRQQQKHGTDQVVSSCDSIRKKSCCGKSAFYVDISLEVAGDK